MEKQLKCVNCGRPCNNQYQPFCSKRCADIDLGKWLNGSYAIPSEENEEAEDEILEADTDNIT